MSIVSLQVQDKHEAVGKRVKIILIRVIGTSIIEAYDPSIFLLSFKCVPMICNQAEASC